MRFLPSEVFFCRRWEYFSGTHTPDFLATFSDTPTLIQQLFLMLTDFFPKIQQLEPFLDIFPMPLDKISLWDGSRSITKKVLHISEAASFSKDPGIVNMSLYTWVVVSNIFYFQPYLGKIPNLTNIFQRGWNHQLDTFEVNNHIFPGYKQHNILLKSVGSDWRFRTMKGTPRSQAHHVWGIYSLQTAVSAVCPCGAQASQPRPRQFWKWQSPSWTVASNQNHIGFNFVFPDPIVFAIRSFMYTFFGRIMWIYIYISLQTSLHLYASGWWILPFFFLNPDPHWDAPIWGSIFLNWLVQPP